MTSFMATPVPGYPNGGALSAAGVAVASGGEIRVDAVGGDGFSEGTALAEIESHGQLEGEGVLGVPRAVDAGGVA